MNRLAAGWHGMGELSAGHVLGAIFAVVLAAAAFAWWLETRDRDRER